jgi:hypothetical protein
MPLTHLASRRPSDIALPRFVSDTLGLHVMESYGMCGE